LACKSLPEDSIAENLPKISDSISYTNQRADTLTNAGDSNLNESAIKNNRSEDNYNITKIYCPNKIVVITKDTKHFTVAGYKFKVFWNDHFNYSENLSRYLGGVIKIEISKNNKLLQVIDTIADENGIGEIQLTAYDYNFDGLIDFTLPLGTCGRDCYFKYYLFNPYENKFAHLNLWDNLRIQSVNPSEKLIKTVVDISCCNADYTIYRVDGNTLNEVKKIHSGNN
jgi:hypothetical protein